MTLVKKSNDSDFLSLYDDIFKPEWFDFKQNFTTSVPAVNIKETETEFELQLAAPGKRKSDFKIDIDENVMTISSESKVEHEEKDKEGKFTRKEFSFSAFKRAFTLPENVKYEDINAGYHDGLLIIHLPKLQVDAPHKTKRVIIR